MGVGVIVGLGVGLGEGVGDGVGEGVGMGVGSGVGVAVGVGAAAVLMKSPRTFFFCWLLAKLKSRVEVPIVTIADKRHLLMKFILEESYQHLYSGEKIIKLIAWLLL